MSLRPATCPACPAAPAEGALCCAACGALLPLGPAGDPFAALGLPRRFVLAGAALEAAYRERARLVHPDRHARADPAQRRLALEHAARLNAARRELADPLRRAEALLRLAGVDPLAGEGPEGDPALPDFLSAQLALRERLAAARAAGNGGARAALAAEVRGWLAGLEGELAERFGGGEPGPARLREIGRLLRRARFQGALLAEAEAEAGAVGLPGRRGA